MKIYISADIEGITGVAHWDEAMGKSEKDFTEQMTKEVAAACYGATEGGAESILIKDAHASGRNIDLSQLPITAKVHKGWSGGPLSMMEGLDASFDGVVFIGYHSGAMMPGNPLAHTFSSSRFQYIKLNGEFVSEFDLNTLIAHYYQVPVLFISGDDDLCNHAKKVIPTLETVTTMHAIGDSIISEHPERVIDLINSKLEETLKNIKPYNLELPDEFNFEIVYKEAKNAYKAQFYPGVIKTNEKTISYTCKDYMEFLKMFIFI